MSGSEHSWSSFLALLSLVKSLLSNRPKVPQFYICPTLTIEGTAYSDDDENWIKEEEDDNIVLLPWLSSKCFRGKRPRASIQQLVTPGPPPSHIPTRLAGRSAKRRPPPSPSPAKIAHSRQRLKEASAEPKHDLFRATWLDQIVAV